MLLRLLLVCNLVAVFGQKLEKFRQVWIEQGLVKGQIYTIGETKAQYFLGIPYAEPPVGELRFQRPVKKERWYGELTAFKYQSPCIQFMDFHKYDRFGGENIRNHQSEECLYLNVFAPYIDADSTKVYPVIVWIHGGSFLAGSGDVGIDKEVVVKNLISKGVVLVTINYRLGPLGFAAHQVNGKWQGNYGVWDQVLALKWIQANIEQFGGDPTSVTVMGESAGAASVSVLALSPVTEGIVHSAIIMSGSSTAGWAIQREMLDPPEWDVRNMAKYIRCEKIFDHENVEDLLKLPHVTDDEKNACNMLIEKPACLSDLDTSADDYPSSVLDCFRNELNLSSTLFRKALTIQLGVSKMVVDGELIPMAGEQFVRNFSRVPIMIGVARREWSHKKALYYGFSKYEPITNETANSKIFTVMQQSYALTLDKKVPNSTLELIGNVTFHRYISSKTPNNSLDVSQFVRTLQDIEADVEFVAPCQREVEAYILSGQPVYLYSWDYIPKADIVEEEAKSFDFFGVKKVVKFKKKLYFPEAFHGLDHGYIFTKGYSSNMEVLPYRQKDERMSNFVCTLLTNFARDKDPTKQPFNNFKWLPYTKDNKTYALLDLPPKHGNGELFWPTPTFWNDHAIFLSKFIDGKSSQNSGDPLTDEERLQLNAYYRAWWALWLLVAAIAIVLWIVIICLAAKKCTNPRPKPYDNIVVTTNERR